MRYYFIAIGTAILLVGIATGYWLASSVSTKEPDPDMIDQAQRRSYWGRNPDWLHDHGETELLIDLRRRGYSYCFQENEIDRRCADEQDESVRSISLIFMILQDHQQMEDKSSLDYYENTIANNSYLIDEARQFCNEFYERHGGKDTLLLFVCLANLTPGVMVPLPAE